MAFEDCMKDRDRLTLSATIENPHMRYLNFSGVTTPGHGVVTLHHNYSHYTKLVLPECDLQKELDNVSKLKKVIHTKGDTELLNLHAVQVCNASNQKKRKKQ